MSVERKLVVETILSSMPTDDFIYILDNMAMGRKEEAELGCKMHEITLEEFSEVIF